MLNDYLTPIREITLSIRNLQHLIAIRNLVNVTSWSSTYPLYTFKPPAFGA